MEGTAKLKLPIKYKINSLLFELKKSFPQVDLNFLDQTKINEKLYSHPINKKYKNHGVIIYGFVEGGNIYLNKNKVNPNTIIHEYGHIWQHMFPIRFNQGIELLKKSKKGEALIVKIKTNIGYSNYSQVEIEAEAFVKAIGDKGENVFINTPTILYKFRTVLNDFCRKLGAALRIQELTNDYKFDKFVRDAVGDILSGKEIVQEETNDRVEGNNIDLQYEPSELPDVISEFRDGGLTDDEIKELLQLNGNTNEEIDAALNSFNHKNEENETGFNLPEKNNESQPKKATGKTTKYLKYFSFIFVLILFLSNPSLKDFKEYLGETSDNVRRKNNFLLFSLYQTDSEQYFGIFKNFILINDSE